VSRWDSSPLPENAPTALVWASVAQCAMLSHALAAAGIRPAFAGSPHAGRAPEIAGALSRPGLSVEPVSDLRAALSNAQVDLAILADPGDFADSDHDTDDLGALHAARSRGVRVLNLDVRETQEAAITLYRSLGYHEIGRHPHYARVGNAYVAGLYFWKDLRDDNRGDAGRSPA